MSSTGYAYPCPQRISAPAGGFKIRSNTRRIHGDVKSIMPFVDQTLLEITRHAKRHPSLVRVIILIVVCPFVRPVSQEIPISFNKTVDGTYNG